MIDGSMQAVNAFAGYRDTACSPTPPHNIAALNVMMEQLVERARKAGFEIEAAGDRMFGSRPPSVLSASAGSDVRQQSLSELVEDLSAAMDRIESGLSRL